MCMYYMPDDADSIIENCISLKTPRSFLLFAGAGSGKTSSLVAALKYAQKTIGRTLYQENRYIGVITYTNAAATEIAKRSEEFPFFAVSTIHSFAWELIAPFQYDIKKCLQEKLQTEIGNLAEKSGDKNKQKKEKMLKRLELIKNINYFTYSPTKPNTGRDSLGHSDVIYICVNLLKKALLQEILISRFPILFIDECQDTKKDFIEILLQIQKQYSNRFMIGLFGDMMQQIYTDGKEKLDQAIGDDWQKTHKTMNFRSPKRVVRLINSICHMAQTERTQRALPTAAEGIVRFFIASSTNKDKISYEKQVRQQMATITSDSGWKKEENVKIITLEHKMAAERFCFVELFNILARSSNIKDKAFQKITPQDPTPQLKELAFFTNIIIPLIKCNSENDKFGVASIVKEYSPFLQKDKFIYISGDHQTQVKKAHNATLTLLKLWEGNKDPLLGEIIDCINSTMLFDIPSNLLLNSDMQVEKQQQDSPSSNISDPLVQDMGIWSDMRNIPFSQITKYYSYIKGESSFDTHQGVKGLEFPRVMVILDDKSAAGRLFSYEKLFTVKELSITDKKNINEGRDNTLSRTSRLFYVICSRAQQSLAIVCYTEQPDKLQRYLLKNNLFESNEICMS